MLERFWHAWAGGGGLPGAEGGHGCVPERRKAQMLLTCSGVKGRECERGAWRGRWVLALERPQGWGRSFESGCRRGLGCACPGRTQEGETALQLAIRNQLPLVVDAICTRGADMSVPDEKGDPPLWLALANRLEDIASTLVRPPQL